MKTATTLLIITALTGCAFHHQPYVAHEPNVALSQTAVFSVATLGAAPPKNGALEIVAIDGKPTSCAQAGCPVWARVAPGRHTFVVRFNNNYRLEGMFIKWQTAAMDVNVPEMKAVHVYHATHELTAEKVRVSVSDLGERPQHGIYIGLPGFNQKYHPVEF